MRESILKNKMILAVDDEPSVLTALEKEIRAACPDCFFDKATTYKEASERMICLTYDVVVLDVIDERSLSLARLAGDRNFPLILLAARPLTPEALKDYFKAEGCAYLPKESLREMVPFLEEVLKYHNLPGWRRLFGRMAGFLSKRIEVDRGKKLALSQQG